MKRAMILSVALAVCMVGCDGSDGSACAVLSDTSGGQLSQIDGPGRQILIEARIVELTPNFSQQLGVNFDVATLVQEDNGGVVGGLSADFNDVLARSGATGGVANRLHLIPGNHNANSFLGVVWQNFIRGFSDTAEFMAAPPFSCFLIDGNSLVPLNGFPGVNLQNLPARDPGLTGATIHSALLDDIEVAAVLQAIAAESLNEIITAPTLTAYDGQRALIAVQDFTPTLGRLTPEFFNAVTAIAPSPIGIFAGLTLEVTPRITADDRVTMDVRLGSQSVSAFLSQQFDAGGQPTDLEFPIVLPSRAHTEIVATDQQTILIGGVTRAGQSQMEAGVPGLKDLPLVGVLFGDGSKFQDPDVELLIMITPRIIQNN